MPAQDTGAPRDAKPVNFVRNHVALGAVGILLSASCLLLSVFIFALLIPQAVEAQTVTTTVTTGRDPLRVAVNPVTNKIYVANYGSSNVTVIDGATNSTTTVAAGSSPLALAVNPVTNKIYVANSGTVTVIDGATNLTATVTVRTGPSALAVNPVTNKNYVPNLISNNVTVIDGATNSTVTVTVGMGPSAVGVNPSKAKDFEVSNPAAAVALISANSVSA